MTKYDDTFKMQSAAYLADFPDNDSTEAIHHSAEQTKESDVLMTRKEAARYINFAPGTLAIWDCTKRYNLNPLKIGRSVRYRKSDLDRFLERWMKP